MLLFEQFWGRAARASNDSRESDARFILRPTFFDLKLHKRAPFWSRSVRQGLA